MNIIQSFQRQNLYNVSMFKYLKSLFKRKSDRVDEIIITCTVNGKDIPYDEEAVSALLRELSDKIVRQKTKVDQHSS